MPLEDIILAVNSPSIARSCSFRTVSVWSSFDIMMVMSRVTSTASCTVPSIIVNGDSNPRIRSGAGPVTNSHTNGTIASVGVALSIVRFGIILWAARGRLASA